MKTYTIGKKTFVQKFKKFCWWFVWFIIVAFLLVMFVNVMRGCQIQQTTKEYTERLDKALKKAYYTGAMQTYTTFKLKFRIAIMTGEPFTWNIDSTNKANWLHHKDELLESANLIMRLK